MEAYAYQARDSELAGSCADKLRALLRLGQLMKEAPKAKGGRPEKTGSKTDPVKNQSRPGSVSRGSRSGRSTGDSVSIGAAAKMVPRSIPVPISDRKLCHDQRVAISGLVCAITIGNAAAVLRARRSGTRGRRLG